jgi:hypothetical protein
MLGGELALAVAGVPLHKNIPIVLLFDYEVDAKVSKIN